jgi:hypothetical protein
MAKVLIDSGPITATIPLRDVPRDKWRELMRLRRRFMDIHLSHDCRCLVEFVNDAKVMFAELGFASPEAMIRDGYKLEPQEIKVAVEWLTLNPPVEPIALDTTIALALGKREIGVAGGKAGPGRGKKTGGNAARLSRANGSRAYILARLDRDGHAELAAKVRAGTMSANAAAIEAGFRKQRAPLEQIKKLWAKLGGAGRKAHLEWTLKHCATCGREGTWEGGIPEGMWCDACCEEGARQAAE